MLPFAEAQQGKDCHHTKKQQLNKPEAQDTQFIAYHSFQSWEEKEEDKKQEKKTGVPPNLSSTPGDRKGDALECLRVP